MYISSYKNIFSGKKAVFTLLFTWLFFYQYPIAKAQLNMAFMNRLDKVFDSICTKFNIKGASAAVLVPNAGTWKNVHGISRPGTPITREMLFGIGSNTKTFVASTMLKLQENGLLSLNDSIGKWIINKPNINGKITIRQLLNHTSGLYNYTTNTHFFDSVNSNLTRYWKKEDILNLVGPPYFAPGTKWDYSNTNYLIAGIIIEKVSGKSIQDAIREYVITPAGLNNTIYYPFETSPLARADQWSMTFSQPWLVDPETFSNYSPISMFSMASSAGCMMQTAEDNALFWHQLTSGHILNTASFNEMRQYVNIGGGDGYGLGIFFYNKALNGRCFYSHGGTFFGYINENLVDTTSKICISVLTNQDSIDNDILLGKVIGALHKVTIQMKTTDIVSVNHQIKVSMHPNPTSQMLTIASERDMEGFSLALYDISGKQQFEGKLDSGSTSFNVEGLASGYYSACIRNNAGEVMNRQKICIVN
jgi:D-alanyl-D-alanine carboxypeptidase